MISLINWFRLTVIDATLQNALSGLSSNTLWPGFPQLTPPSQCTCGTDTLNLLRIFHLHPQLSATAHYHGLVDYNKIAFAPPGCKIIAHKKPGKRTTWAPHRKHGYSLGPAMHHYRCQNIYISTTASDRIMDTLELFPHNYQMPQLSSTDRLLMAAKDMTDAFRNLHPEIPFASVRDDTIQALTDLAAIIKLKLHQAPPPATQAGPAKGVPRSSPIPSSTQILNSPTTYRRQTRSQTTIHTQTIPNWSLPPRVVTPQTLRPSPPRVPTGSQRLSPRNLSQDDVCRMDSARIEISLGNNHLSQRHQANAVIHPVTGKEMEYSALLKDPRLQPLWTRGFGHECGRLFQGIRDIPGTDTCFFIDQKKIPNDRKITYGKIVCDYKPHKKEHERVRLTIGGDILNYSGDVATSTADITTLKILINSTLSTKDTAMMMMDIKNYYLSTPLTRFEYMKMLLSRFLEEIIKKYNLNALAVNGWVYIEIRKGMYGLKQAGLLANQ
jgi:hypothetical protein